MKRQLQTTFAGLPADAHADPGRNVSHRVSPGADHRPSSPQSESYDIAVYRVDNVVNREDRTAIAHTGAAIDEIGADYVIVSATPQEASPIATLGYPIEQVVQPAGLSTRRRGLSQLCRDDRRDPGGRRRAPRHRQPVQHRPVLRGARDVGGQDQRQRRRRRGRAGGPVPRPAPRPRAPHRRDDALHPAPAGRQVRHRHADHRPGQHPRDLHRLHHQPGRQRIRHRHRLAIAPGARTASPTPVPPTSAPT